MKVVDKKPASSSIAGVPGDQTKLASPEKRWPSRRFGCAAVLIVATLLAYLPAFRGGFIFDDNVFLTDNPLIHAPDGLRLFWFSREATDYWPLTSTTLWLEWRLWGMNAGGYHATNVVLHVAEALLLWAVLGRLRVPGAFLGALLFALHPLNAESVTWITQRKNLLAMLFFLLSIFWFAGEKRRDYWLSLGAFLLAMLSKSSTVVLPLVLFGLVVWRRRPDARDFRRLAPFFAVAVGLALAQSGFSTVVAVDEMQALGPLERLLRAGAILWFYLGKTLWPAGLCFDYGPWAIEAGALRGWLPLIAAVAVTVLLWRGRRTWARPALFAWSYFCVALVPVLGFAEVGFMRYSPVSDHYTHLAIVGVCALVGAWWAQAATGFPRAYLPTAATVVVAALGSLTWSQSRIYSDAVTLYRDTLDRNPTSGIALTNLGALRGEAGENTEAIALLERALRLKPDSAEAHTNLGLALYRTGQLPGAIAHYEAALRAKPDSYRTHNNLGAALARLGRLAEATPHFEASLQIRPDYRDAQVNLERARQLQHNGNPSR